MKRATLRKVPLPEHGVRWTDGFLSEQACRRILEELEISFWKPSSVISRQQDGLLKSYGSTRRVSETAHEQWFSIELRRELRRIETRVAAMISADAARFEEWQATRYLRGGRFDPHLDTGYWADEPAGEREKTVVIYLDTPGAGGGTRFEELGLVVDARAGRLVTWDNLLADGEKNPRMLHSAVPVARGIKTVLVTWVRQRKVREQALGGPPWTRRRSFDRSSRSMARSST